MYDCPVRKYRFTKALSAVSRPIPTPYHVRIKSRDWVSPERVFGWFGKPEDAYETTDRAFAIHE
eukprot:1487462-Pyramimonas_sp.AAC.2